VWLVLLFSRYHHDSHPKGCFSTTAAAGIVIRWFDLFVVVRSNFVGLLGSAMVLLGSSHIVVVVCLIVVLVLWFFDCFRFMRFAGFNISGSPLTHHCNLIICINLPDWFRIDYDIPITLSVWRGTVWLEKVLNACCDLSHGTVGTWIYSVDGLFICKFSDIVWCLQTFTDHLFLQPGFMSVRVRWIVLVIDDFC
jgi:hypothetical protein